MKKEKITLTVAAEYSSQVLWTVFFMAAMAFFSVARGDSSVPNEVSAGFAFDRHEITLEEGYRTEAVGPFYYSQHMDMEEVWAVPPFFSSYDNPGVESHEYNFLYPLLTKIRYGHEIRWQLFQLISTSSGDQPSEENVRKFTLFPLYFQQRAPDTNLNYTAVFPVYGHLKNRLFHDEIYFIMFPAFSETRKRDVVTDNYLYPFVHVRHGDGLTGWQVWPFVGKEHKEITYKTDGFGDTTLVPGHDRSFYMWPFYFSQSNNIGGENPETFTASIPLFTKSRSPLRDSSGWLWPFFASIDDRGKKYHEWQGPWPFVIFTRGEGKHTSRVFPLFSESHNGTKENNSYLWPLYVQTRTYAPPLDQQRTRVLIWLYSRASQKSTETGKEKIRTDMWPLFTWHHDFNGNERLQVLALLEPIVPDNRGIQRNWSPLWAVWRSEHNAKNGARSQSLLWNLYRHEEAPNHHRTSVFFGLYQSDERGSRWFYVPAAHKP